MKSIDFPELKREPSNKESLNDAQTIHDERFDGLLCCSCCPRVRAAFQLVTGSLTQVAAGRNEVFGIGTANQIYRYNPGTKAFVQIPGSLAQVAVGEAPSCRRMKSGEWAHPARSITLTLELRHLLK